MTDQAPTPSPMPEPPGIVSVNSRGGPSSGRAPKAAFVLLVIGLAAVGALVGVNKYRATQNQAEVAEALQAKAGTPSAPGQRRIFDTDPPATPPNASASAETTTSACADGLAAYPLLGPDGQPIPGPTGQPMLVCRSGHRVVSTGPEVPAVLPMPTDQQPPPVPAQPGQGTATPSPTASGSRFGGDIVLTHSGPPGFAHDEASPVVPALLTQDGADNAGQFYGGRQQSAAALARQRGGHEGAGGSAQQDNISKLLSGSQSSVAVASMIGNRDMIVPEGRSIDCNLSIRLINDVSGKATCVLSSNVYSDSGRVVLAERGSTATGEYVAMTAQGQRRIFVVWTRLQTPTGVIIEINSPAADALGTSGLAGDVDSRWSERIGAAVLLSLVEDAIGYHTAKASRADGANASQGIAVLQSSTQTGRSLAERILDSTINIKPTLYKNQGDRATIFVSRDLDFGSVYALRAK